MALTIAIENFMIAVAFAAVVVEMIFVLEVMLVVAGKYLFLSAA